MDPGYGVAVDGSGNAYATGWTDATDLPTLNPLQASTGGGEDAFVVKLSATGTLVYSTYLGGSGDERGAGIDVDSAGHAYVTGSTRSNNFPTTVGAWEAARCRVWGTPWWQTTGVS